MLLKELPAQRLCREVVPRAVLEVVRGLCLVFCVLRKKISETQWNLTRSLEILKLNRNLREAHSGREGGKCHDRAQCCGYFRPKSSQIRWKRFAKNQDSS